MSVIDTIKNRHSYRGCYKPDQIPREDLVTVMEAGLAAPSGCNMQTTSLICVDDPDVLARIKVASFRLESRKASPLPRRRKNFMNGHGLTLLRGSNIQHMAHGENQLTGYPPASKRFSNSSKGSGLS